MTPTRYFSLAVFATLALSPFAATPALAAEGPFHIIEHKRLAKGETKAVEVKAAVSYLMSNGTQTIKCTSQKAEKASVVGSTGANSGLDEGIVVFEGCTIEGNGSPCEPVGGKLTTEPVTGTLAFSNEKSVKGEHLLQIVAPTKGTVFLKAKFSGAGCSLSEAAVEGSLIGETWSGSKKEAIRVEENEGEGPGGLLNFPTTLLKVAWTETEGKRAEVKAVLKAFGKNTTGFEGKSEGTLVSKEKGGVFTALPPVSKAEGPFHEVEKKRLLLGESKPVETKATKEFVMANGTQTVRCTLQKVETSSILGSTGTTAGAGEGTVVLDGCTVEGNGTPCKPNAELVRSEPVKGTLAFTHSVSEKGEKVLELVAPAKGAVFATVKFEGEGCTVSEAAIEGSVVGEVWGASKKSAIKVEENELEGAAGLLNFPATQIGVAWTEAEGKRTEAKPGLKSFGKAVSSFEGQSQGSLISKQKAGVFTTAAAPPPTFEGPFHKIAEKRLLKGESKAIETKAAKVYTMANGVQTIICSKQKSASASVIGSTGANAGSDEGTVSFEECTITGNGEPCKFPGGKLVTEPVKGTLAFSNAKTEKAEHLLQVITPVKGTIFTKAKFEGAGCTLTEVTLEGSLIGEVLTAKKEAVKVEGEGEGSGGLVGFPPTLLKVAWTEAEGKRTEVKASLKAFGKTATKFEGQSEGTLVSKEKGGVFTK